MTNLQFGIVLLIVVGISLGVIQMPQKRQKPARAAVRKPVSRLRSPVSRALANRAEIQNLRRTFPTRLAARVSRHAFTRQLSRQI